MSLVIYTKPGCPYCDKARDYYNENNIEFAEYDAQNNPERKKEMLEFSGGDLVVPCIVERWRKSSNKPYRGRLLPNPALLPSIAPGLRRVFRH